MYFEMTELLYLGINLCGISKTVPEKNPKVIFLFPSVSDGLSSVVKKISVLQGCKDGRTVDISTFGY